MVEPVPIGVEVSTPIKKQQLLREFDSTHCTNVSSIVIESDTTDNSFFTTSYGLPRANNNPVSIPCATGATLYNYLMNVTKYCDLLEALKKMYKPTPEDTDSCMAEELEDRLLALLNLPDDPSILDAKEIQTKMIELCDKLENYRKEMVNYNNNQYIGYLIKCEKDESDHIHPKATKYTVLRDRLVIAKDASSNKFDIIDINSSIFGYDMANLQLPDTNIVFRDTQHSDSSGNFALSGITGVNGMTLQLARPDFSESNECNEYYYIVRYKKNEGMDLSLKVSVLDNVKLVKTDTSGHPIDYEIIDQTTKLLASGRGPMLISGQDNSFTQNQEMCNRALNIWAMDGYNYTNQMNETDDWFAIKEKQFKTGLERFDRNRGISTNQRAYNYRPIKKEDMTKGQIHPNGKSQLFINLFLSGNKEFTGQIPITLNKLNWLVIMILLEF